MNCCKSTEFTLASPDENLSADPCPELEFKMTSGDKTMQSLVHKLLDALQEDSTSKFIDISFQIETFIGIWQTLVNYLLTRHLADCNGVSYAQMIPALPLFEALSDDESERTRCACKLLGYIVESTDFPTIIEKFGPMLVKSCSAQSSHILRLAVDVFSFAVRGKYIDALVFSDFLKSLLKIATSASPSMQAYLCNRLLSSNIYALHQKLIDSILIDLNQATTITKERIALLDFHSRLRKTVPGTVNLYSGFEEWLGYKDQLIRMSVIEMLVQLTETKDEFALLAIQGGILQKLLESLPPYHLRKDSEDSIYARILSLCSRTLMIEGTDWSPFFERLHKSIIECYENGRWSRLRAIFCIGNLVANVSTRSMVPQSTLQTWLELFAKSSRDIKVACLYGAASLFSKSDVEDNLILRIAREGLGSLGHKDSFDNLVEICKASLEDELKIAGWDCLHAALSQRVLVELAMSQSSCFRYLLERESDGSDPNLAWKRSVLKKLSQQPWAGHVLGPSLLTSVVNFANAPVSYQSAGPQISNIGRA